MINLDYDEPVIIQLLFKDITEHQRNYYNSIWGKELYPVAFNPLDDDEENYKYDFGSRSRYHMIR